MMSRAVAGLLVVLLGPLAAGAGVPATATAPSEPDELLWSELQAIDAKSSSITALSADFEQDKHTPLLRRPMVSKGRIVALEDKALWTTTSPEPTVMLVDPHEIRLYFPEQQAMEICPIKGELGALASSPLPRLATLRRFFSFTRGVAREVDDAADDQRHLAVNLKPTDPALAEHIEQVRVLLDRETGLVLRAETLDADGDRTVIAFSNVRLGGVSEQDLRLDVPEGTRQSRPLDALGGSGEGKE
jgi:outer membrane lipoprotein-sorting protein